MVTVKKLTEEEQEKRLREALGDEEYEKSYGDNVEEPEEEQDNKEEKPKKTKPKKTTKREIKVMVGEKMIELAKQEGLTEIKDIYKCFGIMRREIESGKYGEYKKHGYNKNEKTKDW